MDVEDGVDRDISVEVRRVVNGVIGNSVMSISSVFEEDDIFFFFGD